MEKNIKIYSGSRMILISRFTFCLTCAEFCTFFVPIALNILVVCTDKVGSNKQNAKKNLR